MCRVRGRADRDAPGGRPGPLPLRGGVPAAIEDCEHPQPLSPHLRAIVDRIRPSVDAVLASGAPPEPDVLMEQVVRRNIHTAVKQLIAGSPLLAQRVRDHEIIIVGAEYSVEAGLVEFFAGNEKQR